jgi:hypothetical protein
MIILCVRGPRAIDCNQLHHDKPPITGVLEMRPVKKISRPKWHSTFCKHQHQPRSATGKSAVSASLCNWLHADHAPINLPHLNDTVTVKALSCPLDCRIIVGAIHNRRRSGYVIVRGKLVNPIR